MSALFIVLAFPPWNLAFLIWIALVPWLSVIEKAENWKKAFFQGVWLSFFMTLGGFYWIASALNEFGQIPWSMSVACLLIFSLFAQFQFLIFAPLRNALRRAYPLPIFAKWRSLAMVAFLTFLYTGIDWLVPKLFKDTLGHSLYQAVYLRQIADLGGGFLLTSLIYFSNETIWEFFHRFRTRREPSAWPSLLASAPGIFSLALLLGMSFVYGFTRRNQILALQNKPIRTLQAGIIQANIGDFDKLASESGVRGAAERVLTTFFGLSDRALTMSPKPEVLIWPETSYPSTFRTPQTATELSRDQAVEHYVRDRGIPLLFGGYDHSAGKDFNAFFFLNPKPIAGLSGEGDLQIYRKNILLLFGEFIPGVEFIPPLKKAFPQVGNFGRGPGPEIFRLFTPSSGFSSSPAQAVTVNPVICYEALFPSYILTAVRNGSQLILNITNDSWFGPYGEPHLHLALSVFRSIESRRPQLRATNTGISALILPDGEITHRSGISTQEILNIGVPILSPISTLMLSLGDWFGPTSLVLSLLGAAIVGWLKSRRMTIS